MEQMIGDQWQQWGLIKVFVAAVFLFIFVRLAQRGLKILQNKYDLPLQNQKYFPVVEMVVWIVFSFWALKEAISDPVYYSVFFITFSLIILFWIGWFAGRDYIAGIIWRSQASYETGQKLIINDINGRISKLGYLNLELEKNDGTVVRLPYSKISADITYNKNENSTVFTYTFYVEPKDEISNESFEKIRTALINSPWHLSYLQPQIQKVNKNENKTTLEIIVHTLSENGLEKLQSIVNRQIAEKKL
ncbi:MAG: hypothetical protein D8M58_17005 [Calditrichaeota bacterium]|nr:MAG: hypothetical protein DWQ03_12135 [Calditrichota bacterium]MBL1207107.1 hypothetical protein [Calditrichota bacterium]NOG46937.1 mechanosensitive ion channel [Calditrichota bacterium]